MKGFYHLHGAPPYYTNCFVLTGEEGGAVAIDPSAPVTLILDTEDWKKEKEG